MTVPPAEVVKEFPTKVRKDPVVVSSAAKLTPVKKALGDRVVLIATAEVVLISDSSHVADKGAVVTKLNPVKPLWLTKTGDAPERRLSSKVSDPLIVDEVNKSPPLKEKVMGVAVATELLKAMPQTDRAKNTPLKALVVIFI